MGINSSGTSVIDQGKFQNIGAITWDTTAKTSNFTATSGSGFFVNTTSGAITVTLPSSPSASDIVGIKDYANTADTNNITIGRNGSNIQGSASDFKLTTEGGSVVLIYVDATKGWLIVSSSEAADLVNPAFITATGGTITTSGNFKIHTFTSPGTFCVSQIGNAPTTPSGGPSSVDYVVVAGGGSTGGGYFSGGAGAGGYRESHNSTNSGCYTASPLATPTSLPVSVQGYPITVGGGGTGATTNPSSPTPAKGNNSVFSTITSTGGGQGGNDDAPAVESGKPGGSGGGAQGGSGTGSGNTPPVSPPQGNNGAGGSSGPPGSRRGGGGGGATAAGNGGSGANGGAGGAGATTNITASPVARAGGGGGAAELGGTGGEGGSGGGGDGKSRGQPPGVAGTANTGGGAGAGGNEGSVGNNGGSGVVIIRYKFQ